MAELLISSDKFKTMQNNIIILIVLLAVITFMIGYILGSGLATHDCYVTLQYMTENRTCDSPLFGDIYENAGNPTNNNEYTL